MRSSIHILATIAILLSTIFASAPAFATTATWAQGDFWEIQGNSTNQHCLLHVHYEDRDMLSVIAGRPGRELSMGFNARNLRPLTADKSVVEASLEFSNGEHYQLVANVLDDDLLYADVPSEAVAAFAETAWVKVRVHEILIDTYSLNGTHDLVLRLVECVKAMRSDPA